MTNTGLNIEGGKVGAVVVLAEPYAGERRTVATCEECGWRGIPSMLVWNPLADAREHNTQAHGAVPRRISLLVDGRAS
jgi:hypothetical protein